MSDAVTSAQELLAAATPGPWWLLNEYTEPWEEGDEWHVYGRVGNRIPRVVDNSEDQLTWSDAELIAAAPTLLAELADEVGWHQEMAGLTASFWGKVNTSPRGCWEWIGSRSEPGGYGRFRVNGVQVTAHRVAYQLANGRLGDEMTVDHLCGNRGCVNPAHLEAVTRGENSRRYAASLTHCKHGHEFSPDNTSYYKRNGAVHRRCRACHRIRYHEGKARRAALEAELEAGER